MTIVLGIIVLILAAVLFLRKTKKQTVIFDSSALSDCRISEFINCNLFEKIIIPLFVIKNFEKNKNVKQTVEKLKQNKNVEIINKDYRHIQDENFRIIKLAADKKAKIVTADFELNKMAQLKGVKVINLNDIYESLKPIILPGYKVCIFLVKEGKEQNQAIGYLDDGSTVVVENAKKLIGSKNTVTVTSVMQSSNNKMVFAKIEEK